VKIYFAIKENNQKNIWIINLKGSPVKENEFAENCQVSQNPFEISFPPKKEPHFI